METELRNEIHMEVQKEVKRLRDEELRIERENRDLETLAHLHQAAKAMFFVSIIGSIILSFSVLSGWTYYAVFIPLFLLAVIVSKMILKSQKTPAEKTALFMIPSLIFVLAPVLGLATDFISAFSSAIQ